MSTRVGPLDLAFSALIGVTVKGDLWSCVEVPDSVELFGTGKTIKVVATVDGEPLTAGLLPTGIGGAHALDQRQATEEARQRARRHRYCAPD
nr:DUF1905 domain-containing protein [Arthrobacter sp. Leaf234]